MSCKMPWWAGSENPPPDKDKIISDLRAEVASLKEELASEQRWASDYMQQLAAANGRVEMLRDAATPVLRNALDRVDVHPCDYRDDAVRAKQCSEEIQALYAAISNLNEDSAG